MCIYLHTLSFGASPCVNGSTYHGESYTSCSSCCLPGTGGSSNTKPPTSSTLAPRNSPAPPPRPHQQHPSGGSGGGSGSSLQCWKRGKRGGRHTPGGSLPLVDTLLVMRQFQATLSLEVVCLCSPCVHHLAMAPTTWSSRICDPLQACSMLCCPLYC